MLIPLVIAGIFGVVAAGSLLSGLTAIALAEMAVGAVAIGVIELARKGIQYLADNILSKQLQKKKGRFDS